MNLESIFSALNKDQMNSSLVIICAELESQGYQAEIEGIRVTSRELFENKFPSLEEIAEPLNFRLYKNDIVEQKFSIKFIDFHKIIIQEFIK
ncbi:MAG: hypothetical protein BroJett005_21840 [Ignavibacteriota bacterium]|nr:MAG: hypothetical protein BroJett005_21840 [Ignavibacteriota bacterium]